MGGTLFFASGYFDGKGVGAGTAAGGEIWGRLVGASRAVAEDFSQPAAYLRRGQQRPVQSQSLGQIQLGADGAGVATILVRPIRLAGNPGRYLRYAVEVPFRLLSRGGEEL